MPQLSMYVLGAMDLLTSEPLLTHLQRLRDLKYLRCKQLPQDRASEIRWIRKESIIR